MIEGVLLLSERCMVNLNLEAWSKLKIGVEGVHVRSV